MQLKQYQELQPVWLLIVLCSSYAPSLSSSQSRDAKKKRKDRQGMVQLHMDEQLKSIPTIMSQPKYGFLWYLVTNCRNIKRNSHFLTAHCQLYEWFQWWDWIWWNTGTTEIPSWWMCHWLDCNMKQLHPRRRNLQQNITLITREWGIRVEKNKITCQYKFEKTKKQTVYAESETREYGNLFCISDMNSRLPRA